MHANLKDDLSAELWDHKHDPWGAGMGAFFAIADALTVLGEDVPTAWRYRPGLSVARGDLAPEEHYSAGLLVDGVNGGAYSAEELEQAGNVLHRYTAWLDRIGRSY